jgi:hypothetical protein
MAKTKKKKKGTSHRRKKRMSGVHPIIAQTGMMLAGAALGGLAGVFGNQAIKSSFTTAPTWVGGAVVAAIGGGLPLFVKPSPFIMGVSGGMMATGAVFAVNETFISLPGIAGIPANMLPSSNNPGFLTKTVGNYRNVPQGLIGNLSGNLQATVGGILNN